MIDQPEVPISADYFILSLMRLDRDHYQRVEAVRNVTGDDMEHFLSAPNGELEYLNLYYLGFSADGIQIKRGGRFSRNARAENIMWREEVTRASGVAHIAASKYLGYD